MQVELLYALGCFKAIYVVILERIYFTSLADNHFHRNEYDIKLNKSCWNWKKTYVPIKIKRCREYNENENIYVSINHEWWSISNEKENDSETRECQVYQEMIS